MAENRPPGRREHLTLGSRPLDAPGSPVTEQQAHHIATGRATWHRKASKPVSLWMFALLAALLAHPWIPEPTWLLVHMVTLGLITNSILVWSQHFTEALLKHKLPDSSRPQQLLRIYLLNVSIILLILGMVFSLYPLTMIGASGVGATVAWHGLSLLQQMRAALPARFGVTIRYYIVASWLLPLGAIFGALLAWDGLAASWQGRLLLAHEAINVLGFVGITVVGTLLTLWPTTLRTVMSPDAVRDSTRALAGMGAGLALILAGSLSGLNLLAAAGLILYALALLLVFWLMIKTCKQKRPSEFPSFSIAAGMVWLLVGLIWATVLVASSDFESLSLRPITPVLVVGFLLQVLLGAMSYLLPARMGGGPKAVREANSEFNRFSAGRVVIVNLCLLILLFPAQQTGPVVRAAVAILGATTLFSFLPLMMRGVRKSVAVRKAMIQARAQGIAPQPDPQALNPKPVPHVRHILVGLCSVLLTVQLALLASPVGLNTLAAGSQGEVQATGQTTTISVEATSDMRFTPETVEVPAGNRLVLEVKNTDPQNGHDLTLEDGTTTGRIDPGSSRTIEVAVVSGNIEGWCSVPGHRALGMVFHIKAVGADGQQLAQSGSGGSDQAAPAAQGQHSGHLAATAGLEPLKAAELNLASGTSSQEARDAVLAPVPEGELIEGRTVHKQTLDVQELAREVAPGVLLNSWTFNGNYMGPTLHGRVGDIFEVTLVNNGTIGHSVDFHAGTVSPDQVMRTIAPGESLVYRFEAQAAGIWLYHCSTAPLTAHLAAGMFGAVVIDPPDLPQVDREYLLVQSQMSLAHTGHEGQNMITDISAEGLAANQPSLTVFNGHATQYREHPLEAKVGERVRIWLLNAGPDGDLSFHMVGSQFDTVYKEGGYLLRDGRDAYGLGGGRSQALDLSAAQGGFVELTFQEAGTYTFVNHHFSAMERGAMGKMKVTD